MTVNTTLSVTDRHHRFLTDKVGQGVFASPSAAVAAALEQMIRDEEARDLALGAIVYGLAGYAGRLADERKLGG